MSERAVCEYRINHQRAKERACGRPVFAELTITIDDSVHGEPIRHSYCRDHGPAAESNVLIAAALSGRLSVVHAKLRRI